MNKIVEKFYSIEFIKYFIIGFSAVFLDISTLFVFKNFLGWPAVFSIIINQLIVCNYIFLLNKFWAFSNKDQITKQFIKYYLLAIFNYLVAIAWMWFFHNIFGQNYLIVRILNIALSVSWNFLLYKFFVYRK